MHRNWGTTLSTLLILSLLVGCTISAGTESGSDATAVATQPSAAADAATDTPTSDAEEEEVARPAGWRDETHSNDVEPNYEVVFPQDRVNQITITIAPDDWEAMQANMTDILGEPGAGQGMGAGGDFNPLEGMEPPAGDAAPPEGFAPPAGGGPDEPGGAGRSLDMVSETPMWVPATITFEGNTWTNVGIRYKGNSSLASAWNRGSLKLPLKFDFDEFEDDYPAIDNQRFFGFKQLSFANGFSDDTYLREALTYDLMQEAGLVAGETAFYGVTLEYGEGPVNLGLYTAVEVIDDTVIANAFGEDSGNIYEGEGPGVSLAEGTFDQIAGSFEKENNEDEADWSDIEALYNALHATTRTTAPEQWRAGLEAVFDVDTFLNWLAVSAVVQNWDTYGAMAHNFYLYNSPATGQLVWLPWDHNMTLGAGGADRPGGGGRPGGMEGRSVSLDRANVGEQWPLIRFLLDDPTYNDRYLAYVAAASETFDALTLTTRIEEQAGMLRPFVAAAGNAEQFDKAVEQLIAMVKERDTTVADFVAAQ